MLLWMILGRSVHRLRAHATHTAAAAKAEIQDYQEPPGRVGPEVLADPVCPVRLLHRDRFVDVDRATDLEDRAALCELDRRIEAVGRHD